MWNCTYIRAITIALVAYCGFAQASAQEVPLPQGTLPVAQTDNQLTYPADFYASSQPQNALDMITRTPGFTLEAGGAARGFGSNAGNVLINGQRPTVKSGGIETVLSRIPASKVERIELIRGADTVEAQGKTLVANIVLRVNVVGSGNASFELRRPPGEEVTPKIDISYAKQLGSWQLSGGIVAFYEGDPFAGKYEDRDPSETLRASAKETFDTKLRGLTLTGTGSRDLGGGTFNINGRFNTERTRYTQSLSLLSGIASSDVINGREGLEESELGADWTRQIGRHWSLKIIGLGRTGTATTSEIDESGGNSNAFNQNNRTLEAVGRATLSRQGTPWFKPEIGLEIAYNRLTSHLDYIDDGLSSVIAGANTQVSEVRAEGFFNSVIRLSNKLKLETGIALEISGIHVASTPAIDRTLQYFKPSAALVWDLSDKTQFRLGARRSISQLDFEAFAASANLVDDRPIAGNASLRPEITTSFTAAVDHRFGKGGAIALSLARDSISGGLAYVPLATGGEALINANAVQRWTLSVDATLPLDALLTDARIIVNAKSIRSTTTDPITGETRGTEGDGETIDLSFRHDLVKLRSAYGFNLLASSWMSTWYVSEVQRDRTRPYLSAYVETALPANIKATLTIWGITGEREYRERRFFTPDRAGSFVGSQVRERRRGAYVNLLFARQF